MHDVPQLDMHTQHVQSDEKQHVCTGLQSGPIAVKSARVHWACTPVLGMASARLLTWVVQHIH